MSKPIVRGIYRGVRVTQIERTTRLEFLTGRYAGRMQLLCMAGNKVMSLGLIRTIIDDVLGGREVRDPGSRIEAVDTELDLAERKRITLALSSQHPRASNGTE